MKFRARMTDGFCMRRFAIMVSTLSKLGKHCVLCLSPDELCFIVFEEGVPKRPIAWCTLKQAQFFSDYNIIGISNEHNQIFLQFSPEMFAKAMAQLKLPQGMRCFKIKLTKRNTPCLTCEIDITTTLQHSRTCTHDIPVEVVPWKVWSDLAAPKQLSYDLIIQMPNMKRLKTICERMKTLGNQVIVEGNGDGVLALKVEKDLATIATYVKELKVVKEAQDPGASSDEFLSVRVDFKKLVNFLSVEALHPDNILCSILDGKLLFMDMTHENMALRYLLPGIAT